MIHFFIRTRVSFFKSIGQHNVYVSNRLSLLDRLLSPPTELDGFRMVIIFTTLRHFVRLHASSHQSIFLHSLLAFPRLFRSSSSTCPDNILKTNIFRQRGIIRRLCEEDFDVLQSLKYLTIFLQFNYTCFNTAKSWKDRFNLAPKTPRKQRKIAWDHCFS